MTTGKAHLAVVTEADRTWDDDSDAIRAAEHGFERTRELALRLRESLRSVIWGQDAIVDGVVLALLAGGHVLLEGAPGLGKTQLVRTLSTLVGGSFARIQFTPDLMPSDIVGTSLVVTTEAGSKDLQYRRGPIFANLVLADEINRATPKTQSALLEAMGERTVSVDGTSMSLPQPFFELPLLFLGALALTGQRGRLVLVLAVDVVAVIVSVFVFVFVLVFVVAGARRRGRRRGGVGSIVAPDTLQHQGQHQ